MDSGGPKNHVFTGSVVLLSQNVFSVGRIGTLLNNNRKGKLYQVTVSVCTVLIVIYVYVCL